MADVPFFLFKKNRKNTPEQKAFLAETRADIRAVIELLSKRGMWSEYHTKRWLAELDVCNDEEVLHLWWDSIVGGAMFEVGSPKIDAVEDLAESITEEMEEAIENDQEFGSDDMPCNINNKRGMRPGSPGRGLRKKMMKAKSVFG